MKVVLAVLLLVLLGACSQPDTGLTGTIEYGQVEIRATAFEVITELPVVRGAHVNPGDVVAQLDPRNQELVLAEAIANRDAAHASQRLVESGSRREQIAQAQALLDEAISRHEEAVREYQRQLQLRDRGLTSAGALDSAQAQRDSSAAVVEQARARREELATGARIEELEHAAAQSAVAEARVATSKRQLDELTIVSPVSGVVDDLPVVRGDRLQPGQTIANVLTGPPFVRFYLPQDVRAALRIGDTISVQLDGVSQPIPATIRWIAQDATFTPFFALNEQDRGYLTYLAEADIAGSQPLPAGFPAQVFLP